jgi:hypothetical protein
MNGQETLQDMTLTIKGVDLIDVENRVADSESYFPKALPQGTSHLICLISSFRQDLTMG